MYEDSAGKYTSGTGGTGVPKFSILMNITEYPDLVASTDGVDRTTLSNGKHLYDPGLPDDGGALAFPGFYNAADYTRIKALEGKVIHCQLWFTDNPALGTSTLSPQGGNPISDFNARPLLRITGAGVDDEKAVELDLYTTDETKTYPTA